MVLEHWCPSSTRAPVHSGEKRLFQAPSSPVTYSKVPFGEQFLRSILRKISCPIDLSSVPLYIEGKSFIGFETNHFNSHCFYYDEGLKYIINYKLNQIYR